MSAYEKMSYALVAVTIIPYIIGLVIEPRVTKYYKVLHIYGRIYAMISSFGLFTIVYSVIYIAALIIDGKMTKVDLEVGLLFFAVGCVVTIPLYLRVYKKITRLYEEALLVGSYGIGFWGNGKTRVLVCYVCCSHMVGGKQT